ncbi:MAG TPA: winged helix-turn-helix transcriptional regulator [Candidatus Pullilachnospira intestinigallinarum]|nr:winged helix-turn-helix transcriptional regulator [Candidatus Pullilachnospira intestinigallinarum]
MEKDDIGFEVKRLDNEIHSYVALTRVAMGAGELTMMQSWIIGYLYENRDQEIFQKDIEANFSIARSTATGILQLMEKKEYIHRETVPYDARLKQVMLTAKGEELQKNTMKAIRNLERKMRSGIPEEDMDTFFRVIRTIRANVENCHKETDRRRD